MAPQSLSDLRGRLRNRRAGLNRLIFGLALLGLLDTTHLWVQQQRQFEEGCFGVARLAPLEQAFDCASVVQSPAGTLLGVSNIVWGALFYAAVALLSALALLRPALHRYRYKLLRAGLLGMGLLYTLYLLYYQAFKLATFCALCLVSAALVLTMAGLQAYEFFSRASESMVERSQPLRKERWTLGVLTGIVLLLMGADLYWGRSEMAAAPVAEVQQETQTCAFDTERPPVRFYRDLISKNDPTVGNPEAPVVVIEYLDPNCPHCKHLHPIMKQVVEKYGLQAQFVFKPVALWEFSIPQVAALYAAGREGKFEAMLEAQFARQRSGGLALEEILDIAEEIGMDRNELARQIDNGVFNEYMQRQSRQASMIGVRGVPTVLINGHFVPGYARTVECLGRLIERQADEAKLGPAKQKGS